MDIIQIIELSIKNYWSSKYIIKNYPNEYQYIIDNTKFLPEDASFSERKYCIKNGIVERPKCIICGNYVKYQNFTLGFCKTCSDKCYNINQGIHTHLVKSKYDKHRNNEINNKRVVTCLEKYGVKNNFQTFKSKLNRAATYNDNDKLNIIKRKQINTNLDRYGVSSYTQTEEYKIKTRKTKLDKYGSETYQNMDKVRQTKLDRYGDENYTNHEKQSQTYKNKSIEEKQLIILKKKNNYKKLHGCESSMQLHMMNIGEWLDDELCKCVIIKENYIVPNICKYFNITFSNVYKRMHELGLDENLKSTSHYEYDINKFLNDNNITTQQRNRTLIKPKEIDIYLPDYNVGIEFNGNYWHSNLNVEDDYHTIKSMMCEENNIRLIHIFEYEYVKNPDKILNWLLSQIKQDNIIYARKCIIKEISSKESNEFLNLYHLQNEDKSKIKLGLYYGDNLVEVMTFGKPRFNKNYQYELIRLCTKFNCKVTGGASKLFNYFIKSYNPTSIISYQNFSKFNGNVYSKLKFIYKELSNPNYVYIKDDEVLSRYQCQKHKLILKYPEYKNLTENEIMNNLGYLKIYDSGNKVWLYNKKEEI